MTRELDTAAVAQRLERLRELYEPEDDNAARQRMSPPRRAETLEEGAARRLRELRAMMELTRVLHHRSRSA